jgi:hypothetical protein
VFDYKNKNNMKKQLLIILIAICGKATAQTHRCAVEEDNNNLMKHDASFRNNFNALNKLAGYFLQQPSLKTQSPVYIPVVFHVVYNTAAQNISTARILDQLQVLNDDFQRLNADTVNTPSAFLPCAGASEVHFCLAERDPNGQSTTGIVTVPTTVTSFTGFNVMSAAAGGDDIWPRASYLNIYVCNLANGILGLTQFPGGSALTDGVVLHYTCVGGPNAPGTGTPYNLGRIGTHNVGHWLNLIHFPINCTASGCQPAQSTMPIGCPTFPDTSCNGANASDGTMFMNFMQGVDDNCMNLFSLGQVVRINTCLASSISSRNTLGASQGCLPVGVQENNNSGISFSIFPNPATGTIQLILKTKNNAPLDCEIINVMGEKVYEAKLPAPNSKLQTTLDVSFLAKGIYVVRVVDGAGWENRKLVVE